jgi:hypothetical protein
MAKETSCKIEKGNLIMVIPLDEKGSASSSGKMTMHASTAGFTGTGCELNGKEIRVNLNVGTKN